MDQLPMDGCKDIGAIINATPTMISCRTALQVAAGSGQHDVMQLLISNGADVNTA